MRSETEKEGGGNPDISELYWIENMLTKGLIWMWMNWTGNYVTLKLVALPQNSFDELLTYSWQNDTSSSIGIVSLAWLV